MLINNHPPSSDKQPLAQPRQLDERWQANCASALRRMARRIVAANHCLPGPLPKRHSICGGPRHAMPLRRRTPGVAIAPVS